MSFPLKKSILILLSLTTISGCSTAIRFKTQPIEISQKHYHFKNKFFCWNIKGVFSIKQPNKTIIAGYEWKQKGMNYQIRIHFAFGIYSMEIFGKPGIVTLRRSAQEYYTARTPEQLLKEQLGLDLPLSNLYYWIQGIPAPGIYHRNFGSHCHLTFLQQKGWDIHFSRFFTIDSINFPRTIILHKGFFTVTIVIKSIKIFT